MIKKLPALKARQNLGQVMNEVALRGDEYIVERAGKPLVAIISMDRYRMLEQDRVSALEAVNDIWEKMKGASPQMIERTIDEAVRATRKKRA
jgi:prevent-host-death family protein